MRRKVLKVRFQPVIVGFFFLFSIGIAEAQQDFLPLSIGSLKLKHFQSGEEARQEINRLHGKAINFQKGYIGIYAGNKGQGKVWVSEYPSPDEAVKAIGKMAQRIELAKEGPFWHFQIQEIEGMPVYFVVGMEQAHYFFQKGGKVIWLAIDGSLARETVRDLVKKIP